MTEPPRPPPGRPDIRPIDPKKFVGGENLEKLKGLLKDVDEFASKVRTKSKDVEETFDRFRTFVDKFGKTVEGFDLVVEMNRKIFEKMIRDMGREFQGILGGQDGRPSGQDR